MDFDNVEFVGTNPGHGIRFLSDFLDDPRRIRSMLFARAEDRGFNKDWFCGEQFWPSRTRISDNGRPWPRTRSVTNSSVPVTRSAKPTPWGLVNSDSNCSRKLSPMIIVGTEPMTNNHKKRRDVAASGWPAEKHEVASKKMSRRK